MEQTAQQENLYDAKIMPKDLLTIVVSCTSPELAVPFNLTVASPASVATTGNSQLTVQPVLQPYLVDNGGKINFPVLGELKVGGLTKREAEQLIIDKLKPYIKETPIVTVRMVNYKISVLGEVTRPGTFTISNEKVNLLEALAMAGDMTVWGVRDNVKLIREGADGKQEIVTLDLNKAETILSPYYWLQQNDIVYVTPNKAKALSPGPPPAKHRLAGRGHGRRSGRICREKALSSFSNEPSSLKCCSGFVSRSAHHFIQRRPEARIRKFLVDEGRGRGGEKAPFCGIPIKGTSGAFSPPR